MSPDRGLQVGLALPANPEQTTPQALGALAEAAEALGYDSLWMHDHLLLPAGRPDLHHQLECVSVLAWLAARTRRIRLGSSVIVAAHRHPAELAKALATVDRLSDGRLVVGVGAGWLREEFEALGVPFAQRGVRTDEAIAVLRDLWCGQRTTFAGRFTRYADVVSQPPGATIPLLVGGTGDAALRRAALLGDGWHPLNIAPDALSDAIASYRGHCRRGGRSAGRVVARYFPGADDPAPARRPFTGTDAEIAADLDAYRATGIDELVVSWDDAELDATLLRWERFAAIRAANQARGEAAACRQ